MLDVRRPSTGALLFAWSGATTFVLSLAYFLYSYLVRFGDPPVDPVPLSSLNGTWLGRPTPDTAANALAPVAIDVALFTAFALHHSLAARTRIKTRIQQLVSPALERSLYTWVASVLFMLVCGLWRGVPGDLYQLTGLAALPGYGLQLLGVLLTIRSSARLDVLDLAGVRPFLDAEHRAPTDHVPLETRGAYRFVRHPLYFGWVLLVFAAPGMTMTRFVFAAVSSLYLAIAIPFEERSLIHTFGAEYRAYQQRVRWRLIPGIY
jgi:protein-S-isoprenylcysteine O-methyltransferase Ste14